jgi:hypothetical protein
MASTIKLRVSLADTSSAIDLVMDRIQHATGLAAQPDYQELDRRELIVELSLPYAQVRQPSGLARIVERHSSDFELLSTWREAGSGTDLHRCSPTEMCKESDRVLPRSARRAVADQLPTARWQASRDGQPSHWELAVPVVGRHDGVIAAVARRSGYSHRFSALDAQALRMQVATEAA